jgi:hypothetical protein
LPETVEYKIQEPTPPKLRCTELFDGHGEI